MSAPKSALRMSDIADSLAAKVAVSGDTPKKTSFSVAVDENHLKQKQQYSDDDDDYDDDYDGDISDAEDFSDDLADDIDNSDNSVENNCNSSENSKSNIRVSNSSDSNKIIRTNSFERKKQQQTTANITYESISQSIPDDISKKIAEWKVKYAFITKGAKLVSTSKQHKFKVPVSIKDALLFLVDSVVKDSTLVFTNDNSMIFADGVYSDLELLDDDE